jgi:hypothetical protein
MARDLDSSLLAQFEAERLAPVTFVVFNFDSGVLRLWSGLGNFVWGGNTYTGAGDLLTASEIEETNEIKAAGLQMTLSGVSTSVIGYAMSENYQQRTCEVYFGAINLDTMTLIGTPAKVFGGFMNIMTVSKSGDTATVKLAIENELVALKKPNKRNYTSADQAREFPADKGLDFIPSIQDLSIEWKG